MVDPKLVERFEAKWTRNQATGCWEWTASCAGRGYGQIKMPGTRRQVYAHRLAWEIYRGTPPGGFSVLHRCDNPKCVNPEHLFLGTAGDNSQDMKAKGRHLFGEKNSSHRLMESQVVQIKALLAAGVVQREIAERYGVGQTAVSRIARGIRWAHTTNPKEKHDGQQDQ